MQIDSYYIKVIYLLMLKGESYGNANCVFFVCHGNMFHGMGRVLSSSVSELTKDQSNIKTSYICWFNISLLGTVQFDKNVSLKPTTWWGGFSSDTSETWGVYCLLGTAHILRKVLCLVPRMCRGDREAASPFPLQVCIYQNRIFFYAWIRDLGPWHENCIYIYII